MSFDFASVQTSSSDFRKYTWKKRIVFLCLIMLFLSGCAKEEDLLNKAKDSAAYENLNALPKEIQDVLYQDGTFFDAENDVKKTKSTYEMFDAVDGILKPVQWGRYMVHDIDRDGEQELVVALYVDLEEEKYDGFDYVGVFDRQGDMVYAYLFESGEFLSVYMDGIIAGSSDESYRVFYALQFNQGKYEKTIVADLTSEETGTDDWEIAWHVNVEKVSEEKYYDFVGKYYRAKGIPWSACDIEGVQIAKTRQEKQESAKEYEDLSALPQEIKDILYSNGTFFDVENKKEYTKASYEFFDGYEMLKKIGWGQYIVYDIDKDGERELAVILKHYDSVLEEVRVFDRQSDMVYAYPFAFRGFLHVYTDGAILASNAADSNMLYTVIFDKGECEETIIADSTFEEAEPDDGLSLWYVNGKEVSEEEFYGFIGKYDQTKEIPWSIGEVDGWDYDYYYHTAFND